MSMGLSKQWFVVVLGVGIGLLTALSVEAASLMPTEIHKHVGTGTLRSDQPEPLTEEGAAPRLRLSGEEFGGEDSVLIKDPAGEDIFTDEINPLIGDPLQNILLK